MHLAKAISGFSNSEGGVVIWGVSTTRHAHSGLDVLSQIEPIGQCRQFEQQVVRVFPKLTTPTATRFETKTLRHRKGDTKGIVIAHIEKGLGDPRQSTIDNQFYFRAGDDFVVAPYEMIKRLFSATDVPDLHIQVSVDQAVCDDKGNWKLGIAIKNTSTAMAEHVMASVRVMNPEACESMEAITFYDHSDLNPGMKVYVNRLSDPIHKGMGTNAGYLLFRMKEGQPPRERLDLKIHLYANKMRSRMCDVTLHVGRQAIRIQRLVEEID